MAELVVVRAGSYHDSVTLMRASRALAAAPGVQRAHVAMATPLNLDLAVELGFTVPSGAGPTDLLVAVRADDPDAALAELDRLLTVRETSTGDSTRARPRTTAAAIRTAPDANLALVSCPGEHAFAEALDAVEAGLSVMVFSDNMPVAQEIALKDRAAGLVMGPDCGTAIVSGVGLGFANSVRRGRVGIVAASGTGAQQVSCLLDAAGVGVSHVLGTGGRDLSAEVGARSTLKAMAMLDADPGTELIVILSKTPDPAVAQAVEKAAASLATPVAIGFLGADRPDLTALVEQTLKALGVDIPVWTAWESPTGSVPRGGALHGLYAGGTLCQEAAFLAAGLDAAFTDFGDDEYTRPGCPNWPKTPMPESCCSTWCSATGPTPTRPPRSPPRSTRPPPPDCASWPPSSGPPTTPRACTARLGCCNWPARPSSRPTPPPSATPERSWRPRCNASRKHRCSAANPSSSPPEPRLSRKPSPTRPPRWSKWTGDRRSPAPKRPWRKSSPTLAAKPPTPWRSSA